MEKFFFASALNRIGAGHEKFVLHYKYISDTGSALVARACTNDIHRFQVSLRLSYDSGDYETKWDAITRLDTLDRTTNAIHLEGNRSCMTTLVRVWRSPATAPVQ